MPSLHEAPTGGELDAAISNAVVGVMRDDIGRGPTKARTIHRGNLVLCVLENNMTKAEQTLANAGEEDVVLRMRHALQQTMRQKLTSAVEVCTGRKVMAFLSSNNVEPDIAAELFVLDESLAETAEITVPVEGDTP